MILYLHGFRSSPESFKARLFAQALKDRGLEELWCCPQLPASPAAALRQAMALANEASDPAALTVVGSSLGGFYATWLAERLGCRAALLNPVVHASRDLATQIGSHRTFHGDEPFEFLPSYVDELARAEAELTAPLHLDRYFLLACTGDEVLDWREMAARYAGCRQRIVEGGDHGISDFGHYLDEVLAFSLDGRLQQPGTPRVVLGAWEALGTVAGAIRTEVFVREQHVPPEEEMDAMDIQCVHAIAYDEDGRPMGTGRLLPDGHIGRMAVHRIYRGRGVGSRLLAALIAHARERGDAEVVLAAQLHAQPFYRRHGFVAEGDTFMDAGIAHVLMRLPL